MPKPGQLTCRAEQFAGAWVCEPTAMSAYEAAVVNIIESGKLMEVSAASAAMFDDDEDSTSKEDAKRGYTITSEGIARIPVEGVLTKYPTSFRSALGGASTLLLQRIFSQAANDPNVKGMLVECDSPGGMYNGIEELSSLISTLAQQKPINFHVHGAGASGMYWLMASGSHITMDPTAMVGSVGAANQIKDTSEIYKRAGVKIHYTASGEHKLDGASGREITPEQVARLQKHTDDIGQEFIQHVATKRKLTPEQIITVSKAGVFRAKEAKDLNLVDSVGFTTDAIAHLQSKLKSTGKYSLPGGSYTIQAVPNNRRANMLTAEQLATAKTLPGCSNITAETQNADAVILGAAISLQNVLNDETRRTSELTKQLTTATAAAPEAPSKRELSLAAQNARIMLAPLKNTILTEACATELENALVGPTDSPNAAMLLADANGNTIASKLISVLAKNDTKALTNVPRFDTKGQITGAQPAARTTPGATETAEQYTLTKVNAVRKEAGLPAWEKLPAAYENVGK